MRDLILHPDATRPTLSAKNITAYWHYLECSTFGHFPEDKIVRENAVRIRFALQQGQAYLQAQTRDLLELLLTRPPMS